MRLTWIPRVSRHNQFSIIALALALGFLLAPVPSAVAQEAAKPALTFQGDAGLILLYVKAEKTADFEALMAKLKEGFGKIDTPEAKQAAASLKLLKAPNGPAPAGAVLYMMLADPTVKGAEYAFLPILYKAFPAEAKSFLDKWQDVKHATGPVVWDLQLVSKMQEGSAPFRANSTGSVRARSGARSLFSFLAVLPDDAAGAPPALSVRRLEFRTKA